MNEVLNFGEAIRALKHGERVARLGWNGKGMYLYFVEGSEVTQARNNAMDEIIQKNGKAIISPHIDMKCADDTFSIGWRPTNVDMFTDDWVIVPDC